tara:strand:- start:804 stop:920 length:117 start_codon:yes stop_codon:yes gene_type:complete
MTNAAIIILGLFGLTGIGCMAVLVSVWIEAVKISDKSE